MNARNTIRVLSILCLLSVIVMILALCRGRPEAEFVPPPFEANAQKIESKGSQNTDIQTLDVQVFRVGLCGEVSATDGQAQVWFTNPEGNEVWLKLRVLDSWGNILGQTGILRPGEYVRAVALEIVPEVGTPIILKVMAYEPETYHGAGALTLNTVITAE